MTCIEHVVRDHCFLLQGGYVFTHTIIEDRVVAFGQQFVDLGFKRFNLFELLKDEVFFILGFGAFVTGQITLTVYQ